MLSRAPLIERFWAKVDKRGPDDCWNWLGCKKTGRNSLPYGYFGVNGKNRTAHRCSWEIHNGQIPAGMQVLHRCDNASCVNPNHLWVGTGADNMADRDAKNRVRKGEGVGTAKLNAAQIREIRRLRASGLSQQRLADQFGTCRTNIRIITSGGGWKHVELHF